MSETPQHKLTELIETLAAATPLVTHLHEDDPLRRKLYDTLLTAQLRDPERRRALQHWMTQPATPPGVALGDPARVDRLRLVPKVDALAPAEPDDTTAQCFTCNSKFAHPAESARVAWLRSHERLHDVTTVPGNLDAELSAAVDAARAVALSAADREGLQSCGCVIVKGNAARVCDRHRAPSPLQCVHAWHSIVRDGNTPPDDACPGRCGATVQTSTITTYVDPTSRPTAIVEGATVATAGDCNHPWHVTSRPDGEPHEPTCPDCGDTAAVPAHKGDYGVNGHPDGDADQRVVDRTLTVNENLAAHAELLERPGKGAAVDITAPVPAGIGCTDCGGQLGTNTRCQTCLSMAPPMPAVQFGKATLA